MDQEGAGAAAVVAAAARYFERRGNRRSEEQYWNKVGRHKSRCCCWKGSKGIEQTKAGRKKTSSIQKSSKGNERLAAVEQKEIMAKIVVDQRNTWQERDELKV